MGSKVLRYVLAVLVPAVGMAQTPADQAAANQAYDALRAKDYDRAIASFKQAIDQGGEAPQRADLRKDLAYTLLKTGETEAARDQFAEVMRLDPEDDQASLEYAFLCYETQAAGAGAADLRPFAQSSGTTPDVKETAAAAFENVDTASARRDRALAKALQLAPDNFSAHEELARLAEQRDDLALASEHYERAWRLKTDRRDLLIDLARVWKAMNREEDANAALIAGLAGRDAAGVGGGARSAACALSVPFRISRRRWRSIPPISQLQRDVAYQKGEPMPRYCAQHPFCSRGPRKPHPPKTPRPSA